MNWFVKAGGLLPLFFLLILPLSLADNATCTGNCTINITQQDTSGPPLQSLYSFVVYGGLTLFVIVLYNQMHKWKEDRGAAIVYGFWGGVMSLILAGMTFTTLRLFDGVVLLFDVNYYFSVLYSILALYGFIAGYYFYQDFRKDNAEEWTNPYG